MGLANSKQLKQTPPGKASILLQAAILSADIIAIEDWVRQYGSSEENRCDDVVGAQGEPPVLFAVCQVCQEAKDGAITMDTLKCLLKLGFSPNACSRDALGQSPIYMATRHGRADLLRVLISAGGDVNIPTLHGQAPLIVAAIFGFPDCVQLILESGANANTLSNVINGTALHLTAPSGQATAKEICLLLFKYGADINKGNHIGRTPLHTTCESRRDLTDIIQFLLDNGAKIDLQDKRGASPLMRAVKVGNAICAQFLVECGADVTLMNEEGMTAFDIAKTVRSLDAETITKIFGAKEGQCQLLWNPE